MLQYKRFQERSISPDQKHITYKLTRNVLGKPLITGLKIAKDKSILKSFYSEVKTKKGSKRSLNLSHKERVVTKGDFPGASVSKPNAKVQKND